ncbi:hypothetical protein EK21DRAFT_115713 [Setomelanomma holmii]|uniref:Uncharacterized protein n=1 Tax=Setomelanomma holmii TaxID=210430 RepID=A0A9P4LK01_9PLEO|nr:hypothetical protein EK21DRAFT_115713 [Setomelanomma holmii]
MSNDLRWRFQRGNIIGTRYVEFANNPHWKFGYKSSITTRGPVSTNAYRPHIIWDVHCDYVLAWVCRTHGGKGLQANHIRPEDRYQYIGLSNAGDGVDNDSPHKQLKVIQTPGSQPSSGKSKSHVFCSGIGEVASADGLPQLWPARAEQYVALGCTLRNVFEPLHGTIGFLPSETWSGPSIARPG